MGPVVIVLTCELNLNRALRSASDVSVSNEDFQGSDVTDWMLSGHQVRTSLSYQRGEATSAVSGILGVNTDR